MSGKKQTMVWRVSIVSRWVDWWPIDDDSKREKWLNFCHKRGKYIVRTILPVEFVYDDKFRCEGHFLSLPLFISLLSLPWIQFHFSPFLSVRISLILDLVIRTHLFLRALNHSSYQFNACKPVILSAYPFSWIYSVTSRRESERLIWAACNRIEGKAKNVKEAGQ